MADNVIQISDFQKPASLDAPISDKDKATFALDITADEWANDMVHALMVDFGTRGEIDFSDPIYGKLMEGMADLARAMTRHHLGVFDEISLLLKKYPGATVHVGVMEAADQESF